MDSDSHELNSQPEKIKQQKKKNANRRRFMLGWLVSFNKAITKLLKKALGVNYMVLTEEEVLDMVNSLTTTNIRDESGTIEENSVKMISNIFEFNDLTAGEVMTHRTNITGIEINTSLDDIIYLALDRGFSRMPVYDGTIDKIMGIIIVKDLLCLIGKTGTEDFNIHDFLREVIFIPEACSCADTFQSLTSLKSGMAIVVDEYGGTAGIVTLEDLVESIMGNIQDEYDDEKSLITRIGDEQYDIDGEADPDDVLNLFGYTLPNDHEYVTISGFVTDILGYIPEDEINLPSADYEDIRFVVLEVKDRCINKLRAVRIVKPIKEDFSEE